MFRNVATTAVSVAFDMIYVFVVLAMVLLFYAWPLLLVTVGIYRLPFDYRTAVALLWKENNMDCCRNIPDVSTSPHCEQEYIQQACWAMQTGDRETRAALDVVMGFFSLIGALLRGFHLTVYYLVTDFPHDAVCIADFFFKKVSSQWSQ